LSTGSIVSYSEGPYQGKGSGETSLLAMLFDGIGAGDILLANRYYCTWAIIATLMKQGSPILVQNHAQRKPNVTEGKNLGTRDHIFHWKNPKKNLGG